MPAHPPRSRLTVEACGIIIIAVGAWAKAGSYVSSLSILGGVIASGVFMLLIGGFGIFGALKSAKGLLILVLTVDFFC